MTTLFAPEAALRHPVQPPARGCSSGARTSRPLNCKTLNMLISRLILMFPGNEATDEEVAGAGGETGGMKRSQDPGVALHGQLITFRSSV